MPELMLPPPIDMAIQRLYEAGFEAFAVGGCVRDLLRGTIPHDYDVTTSALPEETMRVFADCRVLTTGLKHGTVTVLFPDLPGGAEITTYRVDGRYLDHRHPDGVTFTRRLDDDLSRRDFTVNAMAYNSRVGLVDRFGGMKDLCDRVIRCVGLPQRRFDEDGLRILRAMRFASVLEYSIEEQTAAAILSMRTLLNDIAAERCCEELRRLMAGAGAGAVLRDYWAVFVTLLPPLGEISPRALNDFFDALPACPSDFAFRMACLCRVLPEEKVREIFRILKADCRTADGVLRLVRAYQAPQPRSRTENRKFLARFGVDCTLSLCRMRRAFGEECEALEADAREIAAHPVCLTLGQLAVNGRDIASLGAEGAGIGEILHTLLDAVIEERLPNTRESLLQEAKKLLGS